jgi:hypothetical protein
MKCKKISEAVSAEQRQNISDVCLCIILILTLTAIDLQIMYGLWIMQHSTERTLLWAVQN